MPLRYRPQILSNALCFVIASISGVVFDLDCLLQAFDLTTNSFFRPPFVAADTFPIYTLQLAHVAGSNGSTTVPFCSQPNSHEMLDK